MNPLLWFFQFAFGCRHRHLSRIFTIKRRTYKVCFDCGREFDLPDAHASPDPNSLRSARFERNPHLARGMSVKGAFFPLVVQIACHPEQAFFAQ
jgi:hypothetical protein